MYNLIYDYLYNYVFGSLDVGYITSFETNIGMSYEAIKINCCNILTIIGLTLIFIFAVKFLIWIFKIVGGLFRW